jgi:hypothetical protein
VPEPTVAEPEPEPVAEVTTEETTASPFADLLSESPTLETETEVEAEVQGEEEEESADEVASFLDFGTGPPAPPKRKRALGMPMIVGMMTIAVLGGVLFYFKDDISAYLSRKPEIQVPTVPPELAQARAGDEEVPDEGETVSPEEGTTEEPVAEGSAAEPELEAGSEVPPEKVEPVEPVVEEPVVEEPSRPFEVVRAGPSAEPEFPSRSDESFVPVAPNEVDFPAGDSTVEPIPPMEEPRAFTAPNPKIARHHVLTGDEYLRQGSFRMATDEYLRATNNDPSNSRAYNNLGCARFRLKQLKLAEKAFLHAKTLDRDYADPYYNLGCVYVQQGNFKKAVQALNYAIGLDRSLMNELYLDDDLALLRSRPEFRQLLE